MPHTGAHPGGNEGHTLDLYVPYRCDACDTSHAPLAPYVAPRSGVWESRSGAHIAYTHHTHADGNACRLPDAPTVLYVRDDARTFGRKPHDALREHRTRATAPWEVGVGSGERHGALRVRPAPMDYGQRGELRPTYPHVHDAEMRGERAFRVARSHAPERDDNVPERVREPRLVIERAPDGGIDAPTLCTRYHPDTRQRAACARSNALVIEGRKRARRERLRMLRARYVAFDARADAPYGVLLNA